MIETTIEKMHELRLHAMAQKADELSKSSAAGQLSAIDYLSFCVDSEYDRRKTARVAKLLKNARIKHSNACIEDIDFRKHRNFTKNELADVLSGAALENCSNVLISGPTGVGKSYIACAIANLACRKGISTQYHRVSRFLEQVRTQKALGNYLKTIEKFGKVRLLVLDDLGPEIMNPEDRGMFLEIIEERYLVAPTIIASQLPFEQWYEVFGDATNSDAICDRLFHNARKITMQGESMRKRAV